MTKAKLNSAPHWFDPRSGAPAISIQQHSVRERNFEPPRTNCFRIWSIEGGEGKFAVSSGSYEFAAGQLLFFVPYQQLKFAARSAWEATEIQFHANFLCVETFHAETGCSGALFNDLYGPPLVALNETARPQVADLLRQLAQEQREQATAYEDASLSLLKLLLIAATRQKTQQSLACSPDDRGFRHPLIAQLRELIEQHYCTLHTPKDYAELLHVTPKTLGRCVSEQLGKTLTDLIRERLLTHAKWQLLHTLRPVKEIARETGFKDEFYFSRLFKQETGVSPKFFREFETEIRGGSNLSMRFAPPSIRE
ncbi:AraC family transcriptional regulator [Anatilimnocola floriformis]|uniref:AraC family transcriptional regulator n=1 Tax=Anatilimnocola floriformis TaxID=2948575 RepID=UPI0020C2C54C|nr:AraC family transcriptional regulator [Anatilimnocola floriformis]